MAPPLDVWYERHDGGRPSSRTSRSATRAQAPARRDPRPCRKDPRSAAVARADGSYDSGRPRFREDPPIVVHLDALEPGMDDVEGHRRRLPGVAHRRAAVLPVSTASRASFGRGPRRGRGGFGSVGTPGAGSSLPRGRSAATGEVPDRDRAAGEGRHQPSVLAPFVGPDGRAATRARRVVSGQPAHPRPASDLFLGWCRGPRPGTTTTLRPSLWDVKGQGRPPPAWTWASSPTTGGPLAHGAPGPGRTPRTGDANPALAGYPRHRNGVRDPRDRRFFRPRSNAARQRTRSRVHSSTPSRVRSSDRRKGAPE